MSTFQDFKDAPVGSTASSTETSARYVKTSVRWLMFEGLGHSRVDEYHLEYEGFTLNPAAPTNSREALDLAWELAHEVKAGQVIPAGTRYLELHNFELRETSLPNDLRVSHGLVSKVRTHEPLPDTEPEWTKAPAVLAAMNECSWQKVWLPSTPGHWECTCCGVDRHWSKMNDVTPLYPKEDKGGMYVTGPGNIQIKDRNGQTVWEI